MLTFLVLAAAFVQPERFAEWKHSGSIHILTTPDGASLPASASVENFPLLVRLHKDFFDFRQAKPNGDDLRFTTASGAPLAFQIEDWDAAKGVASIWVRVPKIQGNARQEIKLLWGNPDAKSESNGRAVFDESNGYVGVWHMGAAAKDETETLTSKDTGTTPSAGMIGASRRFPGKAGLFCGEKIPDYPSGAGPHSTEAWFRAETPNATIIGWGNEGGGRGSKIRMQLRSPPHIHIDSDFSDVRGEVRLPLREWTHVTHTWDGTNGRIYINGKLDASAKPTMNIKNPARLWIGGWYHNYDFVGDIDEVRVSKVARSAEWIHLQHENQKPMQTLVGPVVQAGNEFGLAEKVAVVAEGQSRVFTAKAGGALKTYWIETRDGKERIVATDRFTFPFDAGRVVGDQKVTLRFKAVTANEVKSQDIAITISEDIPEPEFTLKAPATWDGRATIEVVPQFTKGADKLNMTWNVSPIATIHETASAKLILKRAQNSGAMVVTATADNGGAPVSRSVTIAVTEPEKDAWIARTPDKDEKPEDGQFYARDDKNEGTLFYTGTLADPADCVFLKLYAGDELIRTESQKPAADKSYSLQTKLKPGLIKYRIEFGTVVGERETVLHRVGNLVCGDAYLINGQSNAVATDFGKEDPTFRSEWIRTFGSMSGDPKPVALWGNAVHRSRDAEKLQIGYWGMELGRRLVESNKMPVFLINGAVGGTRVDQHQRSEDTTTIYGRLLWRVRKARLTHGIRAVIWHQGENDQGADGPSGGFGWETYRRNFISLAAAWKQDYPNIQHYYLFQIWPKSCAMGINGSDNRLREVQRLLPTAFSRLHIMSTLGIDPPGGCHFPAAGYAEFARLIAPLIERDHYGKSFIESITPPNLKRASFTGNDVLQLEFDQPVQWNDGLAGQFQLDGVKGRVVSGETAGNILKLKLAGPSAAKTVTYLDSASWSQDKLLKGKNGIAALTFCEVPILPVEKSKKY